MSIFRWLGLLISLVFKAWLSFGTSTAPRNLLFSPSINLLLLSSDLKPLRFFFTFENRFELLVNLTASLFKMAAFLWNLMDKSTAWMIVTHKIKLKYIFSSASKICNNDLYILQKSLDTNTLKKSKHTSECWKSATHLWKSNEYTDINELHCSVITQYIQGTNSGSTPLSFLGMKVYLITHTCLLW